MTRLGQGTAFPGNMALGAVNDLTATADAARTIGAELGALGLNFDFAPVVDVNSNPANPVIGTRSFSDDAQTVANCLRDKIPVIINFENTSTEDAKRIIDFISGTTYALNGEIKKVSQNVFVCAPNNVTVTYTEDDKKNVECISWLNK